MWDFPTQEFEINIIFHQPIIKRTMDTLESLTSTSTKLNEAASDQLETIKNFFQKDSGSEMIESLNTLIEAYLFTENLTHVTPGMREHIVNQLRVATLIAKLDGSNNDIAKRSPPL